ncbi:MAG: nuclear transport factor 2 family protein [Flavobacteriaceae bacterium]|nr:nuclear transport factor 2 family protein [Flavobacteriaceae bacterium]
MKKIFIIVTLASFILSSCDVETKAKITVGSSKEDQSTFEKQIETFNTYRKAFNDENINDLMGTFADSLKWSPPQYNGNAILGYDDVKAQFQAYFDQFEDITFNEGEGLVNPNAPAYWAGSVFSSGEEMATSSPLGMRIYGTWSGVHSESGAKVFNKWYGLLNFNTDGKIAEMSDWMDVSGMQAQIENYIANKE